MDLKSINYFGAIISYNNICDEVDRTDDIKIKFFNVDELIGMKILNTRVVRPKIIIEEIKEPLMIDDNTNLKNCINLKVFHKGFGTANIDIKITQGDKNISKYDSLYFVMINKILEEISDKLDDIDVDFEEELGIDEVLMHKIADSLLDVSNDVNIPFDIDPKYMEDAKEILKDETKREMVFRVLLKNLGYNIYVCFIVL